MFDAIRTNMRSLRCADTQIDRLFSQCIEFMPAFAVVRDRLEAIAERLGLTIVGRHTALGDAIVTAEVFLKLVPLLADKGIRTARGARGGRAMVVLRIKY